MKAFLAALVALGLIAAGANLLLENVGFSSQERTTGSSVRLDD